jgi:hypothetical protein
MEQSDITLSIEMPPGELDETRRTVTRDIYRELRENVDADVRLEQGEPVPGEKAEPITLGLIALAFIKSGAATGIIESVRKMFKRDSDLKVQVKTASGETLEITATNISDRSTREALERLVTSTTA